MRNLQAAVSRAVNELQKAEGSTLHIVKIHDRVQTDHRAVAKDILAAVIERIDTVIANAATVEVAGSVLGTNPDDVRRHMDMNTIGALVLFQAVEPLLRKSLNPEFIALSSNLGSFSLAPFNPGL